MNTTNPAKQVLIIDDEPAPAARLKELFEDRKSWDLYPGLKAAAPPLWLRFEATICSNLNELPKHFENEKQTWDVFVIDRRFDTDQTTNFPTFMDLSILAALRDLGVPGLRIIWTGYAGDPAERIGKDLVDGTVPDAIHCMRLGAWDFVNKTEKRHTNTFEDVVISAIQGLLSQERERSRRTANKEAGEFVQGNYDELFPKYCGQFVAFEKGGNEMWRVIADAKNVFNLYKSEAVSKADSAKIHITYFHPGYQLKKS